MPDLIRVRPWPDPIVDTLGFDPRSHYVEVFYLPTLGPTAFVLLRFLANRFEQAAADFADRDEADKIVIELPTEQTARSVGLGPRQGTSAPLLRTFKRLKEFDFAFEGPRGTFAVRRSLPPISRRHTNRLPPLLQAVHERWLDDDTPRALAERRARRMAFTLAELGEDVDVVEQTLCRFGFLPLVARSAAVWAKEAHEALRRAA